MSSWKITSDEAAKMEAARDDESERLARDMELRYYHAKYSKTPQHIRELLAVIAPDYDPDLPDWDD